MGSAVARLDETRILPAESEGMENTNARSQAKARVTDAPTDTVDQRRSRPLRSLFRRFRKMSVPAPGVGSTLPALVLRLGNSVPPLLAEKVIRALHGAYLYEG